MLQSQMTIERFWQEGIMYTKEDPFGPGHGKLIFRTDMTESMDNHHVYLFPKNKNYTEEVLRPELLYMFHARDSDVSTELIKNL
jgi:hypothetical protein